MWPLRVCPSGPWLKISVANVASLRIVTRTTDVGDSGVVQELRPEQATSATPITAKMNDSVTPRPMIPAATTASRWRA
jgi:hypothetical protein